METLGSYLKSKREALNITLEEMSQVTRIRRGILEAIENNRYDLMPPKVFAQGFMRSYASYLGLDESDVVKRYCDAVEGPEGDETKPEQVSGVSSARSILITLLVLGAGLLLVAALLFWIAPRGTKDADGVPPPRKELFTSSVVTIAPPPDESPYNEGGADRDVNEEAADSASPVAVIVPAAGKDPEREGEGENGIDQVTADAIPGATGETRRDAGETAGQAGNEAMPASLVLQIVASQETWMMIQCDRDTPVEVYLRTGESYTARAQEKFVIKIGNAGGVELFLNDQALGKPGKPGEVIELTLPE